ncbi:PAS/PAC sensor signal transduction histidine kinase [Natranaerovirga hydrolytica]|uniref:histidine kinase n=1 Tax=Natranaerovirga hydrolytica TaxID=680378 RepID=A0A4R1N6W2_9FIRM|nr:ATP-binding protein [Natranaerovirga hydrolytica]TCK98779.1 PAS/PAC sensor signal transduction histidine kinase [Natranaerovirga hydrolytica]
MQKKLFITYLFIVFFTLIVSVYFTWSKSYDVLSRQYTEQFISQGQLLLEVMETTELNNEADIRAFTNRYSEVLEARITIIDKTGEVIADSYEEPVVMDNHAFREEVNKALNGDISSNIRYSNTMGHYYSYTALPLHTESIEGVLRISIPVEAIEKINYELIEYIALALIICGSIALIMALFYTRKFMKPINTLTHAVEEISKGNYEKKIYIKQKDQIGRLADAFNEMAVKLKMNMWKLTQRKTQLEAILSSMNSGIVAVDEEFRIVFYNTAFLKILKIEEKEIVGKLLYDIIRKTILFNVLEKSLETNQKINEEGKIMLGEEEKIISIYANPIKLEKTKNLGILLVIEDMTQIRKLENIRTDFVSNVSHELKTPLTSIRGFVDTLKNGAINDETVAKRFLDIIDIETERLYYLIQDILLLSEIESKQNEKIIQYNKIPDIIDEVTEILKPRWHNKPLEVNCQCDDGVPDFLCNKDRIKQLLINLVDNAIKYTEKGQISIRCFDANHYLVIEVEDTGIGIDQEHIPRLFERFYRVDRGRSRKQGGTGLGLSIVKHIVELYEGNIKVESEVGKGTKFIVKLPYKNIEK